MRAGTWVSYHWRPGQVRAGQSESAALVTRTNPDGTANLKVFADGTPDVLDLRNVPKMSQEIRSHCWEAQSGDVSGLLDRIETLERDLAAAQDRLDALALALPLPPRRGPGRPSNAELAARRAAEGSA